MIGVASARCTCGGARAHHAVGDTCWCNNCLAKPEAERCTSLTPATVTPKVPNKPLPPIDRKVAPVGRNHPETAKQAAAKALPRSNTLRRTVFDLIAESGARGVTDDEVEQVLGRSHQSISACRNSLLKDGHIQDSGKIRLTRWKNEAIAWVVTDPEQMRQALTPVSEQPQLFAED